MNTASLYELQLGEFSGPLDKLLELIESRKMDINQLSLAKVTDDFLKYVEGLDQISPALLADFIVVASQLISLKSKSLLPELPLTSEEEGSLEQLEARLKAYREFKEAGKQVANLWRLGAAEASRPYFLSITRNLPQADSRPLFYPGNTLTIQGIVSGLSRLAQSLEKIILEEETVRTTVVTLEEKMRHILGRLHRIQKISFSDLSVNGDRAELVVAFLAILHLAREQTISIEQTDHFSDIIIRHKSTESYE